MKNKTNFQAIAKQIHTVCRKTLGRDWKDRMCDAQGETWNDNFEDKEEINRILKPYGFTFLGSGAFRVVIGWKDVVFKINNSRRGNEEELEAYNDAITSLPTLKYFMCPIIASFNYGTSGKIIVAPKMQILNKYRFPRNKPQQKKMADILEYTFEDMHNENLATFCDGIIATDVNCGFYGDWFDKTVVTKFISRNKGFWTKYTRNFNKFVKTVSSVHC